MNDKFTDYINVLMFPIEYQAKKAIKFKAH